MEALAFLKRPSTRTTAYTHLFLAWLIYFSSGMIMRSIPPFLTSIIQTLGLNYSQAGTILASWQIAYIVAAFPVIFVIDRIGTKNSLSLGLVIISISAALRAFSTNFETLLLAVAVFGIGAPIFSISLPKLVTFHFVGKQRGTAVGIYVTGITAGSAVSLATANSLLLPLAGTWQKALFLYALFAIAVLIIWLLFGREPSSTGEETRSRSPSMFKTMSVLLKNRDMIIIILVGIAGFSMLHGFGSWLPGILESRGVTRIDAGLAASIWTILNMAGSLVASRLSDIMGSRKRLLVSLLSLGGMGLFLIGSNSSLFLWPGLILSGVTSGGILPLMIVSIAELPEVGPERMAEATGIYFTVGEVGGFLAPLSIGYFKDITGSFLPGIGMLILLLGVMVPIALLLKETK